MKNRIRTSAIFLLGILVGIAIMTMLSRNASKTYLGLLYAGVAVHESESARRAFQEGDDLSEYRHQHNLADLAEVIISDEWDDLGGLWPFHLPFVAPWIDKHLYQPDDALRKGYGLELARLAESMEHMGLHNEAKPIWEKASRMTGFKDEELNRLRTFRRDARERIQSSKVLND